MKKYSPIYQDRITFENLYKMWGIVRKTCKNKSAIFRFARMDSINISIIVSLLKNKKYIPYKYRLFLIFEPKPRLVMSQSIVDKIVNHFVTNYYLIPYLEPKLIDSNVATRKGKGSSYADKLLRDYINEIRMKHKGVDIYCLKLDISKYFYNIDHDILINMLKKDGLDSDVINLIKIILDETNKSYINQEINYLNDKYHTDIPFYKNNVGLSIGAMSSQFLAIYYLNDLDHYIKEVLKCKYYIRYMDDFLILDVDKNHLKDIWNEIADVISNLKLTLNPKSNIFNLKNGITFIGHRYKILSHKFVILYKKSTYKKIRKRLAYLFKEDKLKYYRSLGSYYGYLKKGFKIEANFKMNVKEKYEYYKEKYPYNVVLIKDGSFFRTFESDGIMIWNLMNYKWHNESIAFGNKVLNKVLNELRRQNIGYYVSENEVYLKGNEEVYELYKRLSQINYKRYQEKMELNNLLNDVLIKNRDSYGIIKEFLESFS